MGRAHVFDCRGEVGVGGWGRGMGSDYAGQVHGDILWVREAEIFSGLKRGCS